MTSPLLPETAEDMSAVEIAGLLDTIRARGMPNRGESTASDLTVIVDAACPFSGRSVPVSKARAELLNKISFLGGWYTTFTGEHRLRGWDAVTVAAGELAIALRGLGEMRIARCARATATGTCRLPLRDDGQCRSLFHTDI